jgi:hypothetical protein
VTGAQHPAVQRLQFFLSESRWDPERVNTRRLELLLADPATAPHGGGVLVVDGKTDNGVVTVTTVWADERVYYPGARGALHPGAALRQGQERPGVRHQAEDRRGTWRSRPATASLCSGPSSPTAVPSSAGAGHPRRPASPPSRPHRGRLQRRLRIEQLRAVYSATAEMIRALHLVDPKRSRITPETLAAGSATLNIGAPAWH